MRGQKSKEPSPYSHEPPGMRFLVQLPVAGLDEAITQCERIFGRSDLHAVKGFYVLKNKPARWEWKANGGWMFFVKKETVCRRNTSRQCKVIVPSAAGAQNSSPTVGEHGAAPSAAIPQP